jgi:hypothetical protein
MNKGKKNALSAAAMWLLRTIAEAAVTVLVGLLISKLASG